MFWLARCSNELVRRPCTDKYRCEHCPRAFAIESISKSILEQNHWNIGNVEHRRKAIYQAYIQEVGRTTAAMDEAIGEIIAVLDNEVHLKDRTVVIFCSDQGAFLGEHGLTDKRLM